ncbi:MAG: SurA N-terminal domain-containing protein [Pseudomonadota bacterium]|nr:SurA N-terminal domain-containing protein [Pseudomonadota bacterium]
MFEFIRTHKRLMQIFLMLLIVPSFVLVGVSSYQNKGNDANAVADVDGQKITQQEWEAAQRQQIDRYRQMAGPQFDQKMFETPAAKQAILENLVAERALAGEMTRNHLTITDAMLAKVYAEQFQGDVNQYKATAASLGLTTTGLDARVRRDLSMQQLSGAVQGSAFAPRSVATRLSDINDQEREVQELLFPAAAYVDQVKVTDAMVKEYYDKNAALFAVPEQVKAEYVLFTPESLEGQVSVSDAEVADFYAKNQKTFATPEARTASHILINAKKDAPAAEKAAAKAKAEAILAQLRKSPGEFAKLAKAQSQDPGSAELGGDLGVVEKGAFVKPVEDAIFQLKQGEISDVVASEYGYHIITVTALKPATAKTLEQAKDQIVADLKKQKMSKKYSELAEAFSNTLYEQSDSLKPAADKLKLKIETIDNLTRKPAPALASAPYNNAKFLAAIFADDSLKNKRNTEAVQAGPNVLIAGRVVEFKPASKRPLAEVDAVIRQRVTLEEAAKLAHKAGEAKMAAVMASGDLTGFGAPTTVSRTKQPALNPAAALAVLKADVSKLPSFVSVDLPGQGFGLYRIGKVAQAPAPDAARRTSELEQITNALGQQDMYSYIQAIKLKAKVKLLTKPVAETTAK